MTMCSTVETWEVGTVLPTLPVDITRESLIAYAAASGDHNRIHWDEDFATSVGLDGVIAHGMFTMGAAVGAVEQALPHGARVLGYTTKFSQPVVVPRSGSVTVHVTPTVSAHDSTSGMVTFTLTATCQDIKVLGLTRVTVQLPSIRIPSRIEAHTPVL